MRESPSEREADFSRFAHAVHPAMLRTARLLTGDPYAAQDLAQSALLRIYMSWGRSDTWDNPQAYARRTLVNVHATWRRRHWYREIPHRSPREQGQTKDPAQRWGDLVDLERALAALPSRAAHGPGPEVLRGPERGAGRAAAGVLGGDGQIQDEQGSGPYPRAGGTVRTCKEGAGMNDFDGRGQEELRSGLKGLADQQVPVPAPVREVVERGRRRRRVRVAGAVTAVVACAVVAGVLSGSQSAPDERRSACGGRRTDGIGDVRGADGLGGGLRIRIRTGTGSGPPRGGSRRSMRPSPAVRCWARRIRSTGASIAGRGTCGSRGGSGRRRARCHCRRGCRESTGRTPLRWWCLAM